MKRGFLILLPILLSLSFANQKSTYNSEQGDFNDLEERGLEGEVKVLKQTDYAAEVILGEITEGDTSEYGRVYFEFDTNGNIIESRTYYSWGTPFDKYKYQYDTSGKKIEKTTYDSNTHSSDYKPDHPEKYQYDANGNMIESASYGSNGDLMRKYNYLYAAIGKKIEMMEYDSEGLSSKSKYQYDTNGNAIKKEVYGSDGTLRWKFKYKYDTNGNQIELAVFDSEGHIAGGHQYSYELDKQGNWIKRIEYAPGYYNLGTPETITIREIEYY